MSLPTEAIGSIPRPQALVDGMKAAAGGRLSSAQLDTLFDDAVRDTIRLFEATGSPVITDGEQRKPSFATYPIHGWTHLAPGGVSIPSKDGHQRQLPVLTGGPFRYVTNAASYLDAARSFAHVPLKQAVISASALSLLYPQQGIAGYSRDAFVDDLVNEAEKDIRQCLDRGARVQIDFTEGRLACKLDPSTGRGLRGIAALASRVLDRRTIAASRRSATTCQRRATPRSRRFARG
jgi:5-methyltetrahydropteroyltriglutamate--homocysteine methyltransferase